MAGVVCRAITEFIKEDDYAKLRAFLESRSKNVVVNIDDRDEEGNTPLIVAAAFGRVRMIDLLIANGSDVTAENDEKCTALHLAAREGHADACAKLLDAGAKIDATDVGQWTPLIWACYKRRVESAETLLMRGAEANARGAHHASTLVWASGRGCKEIVKLLIEKGAKLEAADKYGTTSLIWASRNGHAAIVDMLLRAGSVVDANGMYSWCPLTSATKGNFVEIVDMLLDYSPNLNAIDKDGMTSLTIACKEGFDEIAFKLLAAGAKPNVPDRAGDTSLIHASKAGNLSIVEALLKRFADVDIRGKEGKTSLHWAVDKNHPRVVRALLSANPDLDIKSAEGDTPLLRAVRVKSPEIVQLLLEKKAKMSATDRKGNNALHVAMKARSKAIVEILLRNPKHSQQLYRPNRQGETPYMIDANSNKPILGQVFGARRLNRNEDSENILGYDLYSTALADILVEPSLSMPITVGLYAKWGSGKSFLLDKIRREMKSFTRSEWTDPKFHLSPLLFFLLLQFAVVFGVATWILSYTLELGIGSAIIALSTILVVMVGSYVFLVAVWKGSYKYDSSRLYNVSHFLARQFTAMSLVFKVMFCHPPGHESTTSTSYTRIRPLRLVFTDQTKVVGGENSVTHTIGSLLEAVEEQYGRTSTALFRALRPKPTSSSASLRFRKTCCLPYIFFYTLFFIGAVVAAVLLTVLIHGGHLNNEDIHEHDAPGHKHAHLPPAWRDILTGFLYFVAVIMGIIIVANAYTLGSCIKSLLFSQRRHLQKAVAKADVLRSEGYLQAAKSEVCLLVDMVRCLDAFTTQQTRLVVIVDGLDSCEQTKVLDVLEAVQTLFSESTWPFIILLAIDPHVITKAIELNLNRAFSDTSIGGENYLKNLVHLPFYLQNAGLRKVKVAQQLAAAASKGKSWLEVEDSQQPRKYSNESRSTKRKPKSRLSDSVESSINRAGGFHHGGHGPQDMTKILLTDDYFGDVNPRSMRRLLNVVYVMGRLMKAFHIDFNWYHLAWWANLTEQWPYRLSWIALYAETHDDVLEDTTTSLYDIYDKVKAAIPTQKELEPLLERDADENKFDAFLKYHRKNMTIADLKIFLPFTIHLDPYVKKAIKDDLQEMEMETSEAAERGPLTRRQAVGLTKWMNTHSHVDLASQARLGVLSQQQPPLNSTASMMMMANWPYFMQQPPPFESQVKPLKSDSPTKDLLPSLPAEICQVSLSERSVEQVCDLIRGLDGLTPTMIDNYCSAVTAQNVTGTVLAHCRMEDLKSVVNMNFGDWEIFRLVVATLKSMEKNKTNSNQGVKFSLSSTPEPQRKEEVSTPRPNSTIEKQVQMEDVMISGLLSTLNEEAHEDVITEETRDEDATTHEDSQVAYSAQASSESDVLFLSHMSPAGSSRVALSEDPEWHSQHHGGSVVVTSVANSQVDIPATTTSAQVHAKPSYYHPLRDMKERLKQRKGSVQLKKDNEGDFEDDPYAWLSAPASPSMSSESRHRTRSEGPFSIFDSEEESREHVSFTSSVEKLAKVTKRVKHAMHNLDSNPIPPVQRASRRPSVAAKEEETSSEGIPLVSTGSGSGFLSRLKLRRDSEASTKAEDSSSSCSSPEQETVSKRPSLTSARGPPVQELFRDDKEIVTAVLPDGQVMKASIDNNEEQT